MKGAFTTEPGSTLASIWQKGAGVSADNNGNIYAATGEGNTSDPNFFVPASNLTTSLLKFNKFNQYGTSLALTDWFTPWNYQYLAANDLDLSNGVLLLPDQPGLFPYEAITVGKESRIYVLKPGFKANSDQRSRSHIGPRHSGSHPNGISR